LGLGVLKRQQRPLGFAACQSKNLDNIYQALSFVEQIHCCLAAVKVVKVVVKKTKLSGCSEKAEPSGRSEKSRAEWSSGIYNPFIPESLEFLLGKQPCFQTFHLPNSAYFLTSSPFPHSPEPRCTKGASPF
jgi:hypothetical protein